MRKPAFCICENKDADQLRGNREADQRLSFRYKDSTVLLLPIYKRNFQHLSIFCGCTAWFVSDLIGNPENRFSHNEAHLIACSSCDLSVCNLSYFPIRFRPQAFDSECASSCPLLINKFQFVGQNAAANNLGVGAGTMYSR